MSETDAFPELIERIRNGDSLAATELVRRFEPEIRRRVRTWLRVRGVDQMALIESMDICQSILGLFFSRVRTNYQDLSRPEQVLSLLVTMARRKVGEQARDSQRQKRDATRNRKLEDCELTASPAETPSRIVAGRELWQEFRSSLSPEERQIADLRVDGTDWTAIAAELGGTPDSRRKQWSRALARVSGRFGLGTSDGS